ncbi:MAG TPA: SprB repeat-containing protein, partial [Flavobacteriales bacterium]|nr:SprB repeat-containing protein [Flavobacteriales bacterium]
CAGTTYTVTLTDSTGCDTTITFNVDPFTDILANISSTPTLCSDTCNGTATAGPTGGTPPYTFSWSPEPGGGQGTPMATGLCPGSYDLLITDSVGCPHTESVLILGPDPIVDNAVVTPISCGGECDGTITLNATGGDGTYQYSWSPNVIGQGTGAAIDLCAGTYNVTVTDGNGCDSTFTYVLIEPPVLVISTSSTSSQCSLCVGTATVQISGGTLGFVIAWTDALGNNVGSTATLIDLCAGIYTVLVTDTNGCSTQSTVPVSDEDSEVLTTASGVTSCTNSCDGIVSVSYVCSAPLCTVLWTDALGNDLNQPTDQATGLCPGIYYVQVTNGNGCVSIDTAFVTPPTGLIANISSVPVSCSGECNGEATVGVSGVSGPFTFTWSPEPPPINGQGTPSVTGLCAGTYSILITYGAGCDTTVSVLILEPLPLALAPVVTDVSCNGDCDGTIAPTAQGGDGSYTYFWTPVPPNGQGVPIATGLCAGDHILTVTDGNGCSITDT